MEERIWVKIDGLQLHHLVPAKRESAAWASLKLGSAFNINGLIITKKQNGTVWFSQGFGNADARFIDVPILHEKPTKGELLLDVLAKAIHDFCLQRAEVLRPFIENGKPKDMLTFGSFKPEDWQGKSLMIPVDFIRLQNFQSVEKSGRVTADIQIGHHLIFWHVKISDPIQLWDPLAAVFSDAPFGEERIQHTAIHRLIKLMVIMVPDVKKTISAVAEGNIDMESKFIEKVKACDLEATPPPIRFE